MLDAGNRLDLCDLCGRGHIGAMFPIRHQPQCSPTRRDVPAPCRFSPFTFHLSPFTFHLSAPLLLAAAVFATCALAGCDSPESRADLVVLNGPEPESIDPAEITRHLDGRV